jgi:hypothetical protein
VEAPIEAVYEAIEAADTEAIEAGIEHPRPWAEGAAEDPAMGTGSESAPEPRPGHAWSTPAHVLGVKLAGSPQYHQ